MCGILGTYERIVTAEHLHRFRRALALLNHRGPDRTRVWHGPRIALGHTRLAIVDLSETADQPLCDRSGRYRIVFNGEIYNYVELRRQLATHGAEFRTDSDTEVILEAYKTWGTDCLQHFNGMFALAIYDVREHRLFAARDRYGVKPLYFGLATEGFCFASEMKALLALGASSRPNWSQITRYLQGWGCDAGPETVYAGVRAVPPGHFVEVSGERLVMQRWWDILSNPAAVPAKRPDRVAEFRALLSDAVRLRLRNDVETGVCLSGGMDSSAVYGFARDLRRRGQVRFATSGQEKQFRVFSVSHPGTPVDECSWVQQCVRFWNDDEQVSVVRPKPELFPALIDDLVWHQEAPVWSASVLALHIMYRHVAEQGTRVILEGHGGDELLGGYPYLVQAAIDSFAARGDWRHTWQAAQCLAETRNPAIDESGAPPWKLMLRKFPRIPRLRRWLAWQMHRMQDTRRPSPRTPPSYFSAELAEPGPRCVPQRIAGMSALGIELYAAFTQRILPLVLRVVDRATMAYGIESRAPLLDHRVVQFAFSLPDEDKIARQTKQILRAATAGLVPDAVRRRRAKLGFAIAEREWFNAPVVREYLQDVCSSAALRQCDFVNGRMLRADVARCARDGFTWRDTTRIWEALNVFLWQQRFVDRAPLPACDPAEAEPAVLV